MSRNTRNTVLLLILAFGLGVILFFATTVEASETSGEFYQWTLSDSGISVTDDVKRIPAKYQDIAVKRSFTDLAEVVKATEIIIPSADRTAALEASLDRGRKLAARLATTPRTERCDGPITVAQERRDHTPKATSWTGSNSYNSMFYVSRDSCGDEVSVTLTNPHVLVIPNVNR